MTLAGLGLIAGLGLFFFRPRKATEAVERDGLQEVRVVVKGGYWPDVVRARAGVPLRIVFDRQEDGDCSARVVFADLAQSSWLAPHAQTTVDLLPDRPGRFGFSCGMNMIHGTLLVEAGAGGEPEATTAADPGVPATTASQETEDAEAAARRAEVADLVRRLVVGSVLTAPVLVTVMARWRVRRRLGTQRAVEPVGAAGPDRARDDVGGLADPPHRMAGPGPQATTPWGSRWQPVCCTRSWVSASTR